MHQKYLFYFYLLIPARLTSKTSNCSSRDFPCTSLLCALQSSTFCSESVFVSSFSLALKFVLQIPNFINRVYLDKAVEDDPTPLLLLVYRYLFKIVINLSIKYVFVEVFRICISICFCEFAKCDCSLFLKKMVKVQTVEAK